MENERKVINKSNPVDMLILDDGKIKEKFAKCEANSSCSIIVKDNYEDFILESNIKKYDILIINIDLIDIELFIKDLKNKKINNKIPIIIVSKNSDHEFMKMLFHYGIQDYIINDENMMIYLEYAIIHSIERHKIILEYSELSEKLRRIDNLRLESLEKMNREFELAQKVQEKLLPRNYEKFPGVNISTAYMPLGKISGDIYDIIKLSSDEYLFYIVDVVGHGVAAALMTSVAKLIFTQKFKKYEKDDDFYKLLIEINREFYDFFESGFYLTSFAGIYNIKTKKFLYSQMGHPAAICFNKKDKKYDFLETGGTPLGLMETPEFIVKSTILNNEDSVLFYTDGLVEIINSSNEEYSCERLKKILSKISGNVEEIIWGIIDDVTKFYSINNRNDDITILIFKVNCGK